MSIAYADYGVPTVHRTNFRPVSQPVNRSAAPTQSTIQPTVQLVSQPSVTRKQPRSIDFSAPLGLIAVGRRIVKPTIAISRRVAKPVAAATIGLGMMASFMPAANASTPSSADNVKPVQPEQSLQVSAKTVAANIVRDDYKVTIVTPSPTVTTGYKNVGMVPDNSYFQSLGSYDEQARHNAALIITIGRQEKFSDHAIAIAVATSIQECNLINVHYGDRNSLGLYQQQWSIYKADGEPVWGTAKQVVDPVYATKRFYESLAGVANRDTGDMKSIALEIQNPSRAAYMRWAWDSLATQIVSSYPAS